MRTSLKQSLYTLVEQKIALNNCCKGEKNVISHVLDTNKINQQLRNICPFSEKKIIDEIGFRKQNVSEICTV